jgi:hypothetical protein
MRAFYRARNFADTFVNANFKLFVRTEVKTLSALALGALLLLCARIAPAQALLPPPNALLPVDQAKIALHFRLLSDGGAIDLVARRSSPVVLRETARLISDKLSAGNFDLPLLAKDQSPPHLDALKKQKSSFAYKIEGMAGGIRIRITTADPAARAALHEFLRFQISANKTGDSMADPNPPRRSDRSQVGTRT